MSYNEVAKQYPTEKLKLKLLGKLQLEKITRQQYETELVGALGPLFRIPFWRIVLDEAHAIKNKDSHSKPQSQLYEYGADII